MIKELLTATLFGLTSACAKAPAPPTPMSPLSRVVCTGLSAGAGTGIIAEQLIRQAGQLIPPDTSIRKYSSLNEGFQGSVGPHLDFSDLDDIGTTYRPNDLGQYGTAVCAGPEGQLPTTATGPDGAITRVNKEAGIPTVSKVCIEIQKGDSPEKAVERALRAAGNSERYNVAWAENSRKNRTAVTGIGLIRAGGFGGNIYEGDQMCAGNKTSEDQNAAPQPRPQSKAGRFGNGS